MVGLPTIVGPMQYSLGLPPGNCLCTGWQASCNVGPALDPRWGQRVHGENLAAVPRDSGSTSIQSLLTILVAAVLGSRTEGEDVVADCWFSLVARTGA
jgi:hypothetical protein